MDVKFSMTSPSNAGLIQIAKVQAHLKVQPVSQICAFVGPAYKAVRYRSSQRIVWKISPEAGLTLTEQEVEVQ